MSSTKPRCNPLLWAHLRPQRRADDASLSAPPLVPENKTNTSLRIVLHDTKAVLEQFSDRLGNLLESVDDAKRQVVSANATFADVHEKTLEELVATVNRSQKGLLEALGDPAQAATVQGVRDTQVDMERRLEAVENRMDLVHKQLVSITDQQAQILLALSSITPLASLLKDSPQQQTQMLTMLTPVVDIIPLLRALPSQIKAVQRDLLRIPMASDPVRTPKLLRPKTSIRRPSLLNLSSQPLSSDPIQNTSPPDHPDTDSSARKRPRIESDSAPLLLSSKTPLREPSSFRVPPPKARYGLITQSSLPASHPVPKMLFQDTPKSNAQAPTSRIPRQDITPTKASAAVSARHSVTSITPRLSTANTKSHRRILLDDNADEDVDIDLDWGDMACS